MNDFIITDRFFFPLVFWEKPKLFNILTKYYFTSQPY